MGYKEIRIPNLTLQNLSKDLLKSAFDTAMEDNEVNWRNDRQMLLDFFRSQQADQDRYLKDYFNGNTDPAKDPDYPHNLILSTANFTAKVINKKAKVYKRQPSRLIDGNPNDAYNEFLRRVRIQTVSKVADRMTWLLGDHALVIIADGTKEKLRIDQPPYYRPLFGYGDDINPIGIAYPGSMVKNKQGELVVGWQVWTEQYHSILEEGTWNIIKGPEANWHGCFNALFMHRLEPLESHWTQDASDLIEANRDVNVALTSLNNAIRFHGFPKLAALGIDPADALKIDVRFDKLVAIAPDENGGTIELKYLTPTVDWEGLYGGIKTRIAILMQTWNLDIRWELSGTIASGIALKILSMDNTDDLQDTKELYEEHLERRLFEKAKLISSKLRWLKPIKGELLEAVWPEEELIQSETEKLTTSEKEIALNLTNPIELMTSRNADLDVKDAAARFIRNVRVNNLIRKGKFSEEDLLAALSDVSESEVLDLLPPKQEEKGKPAPVKA